MTTFFQVLYNIFNFCDDVFTGTKEQAPESIIMPRKRKEPTKPAASEDKMKLEDTNEYWEGVESYRLGETGDCCPYPATSDGSSQRRTRFWNGYYHARIAPLLGEVLERPLVDCGA